MTREIKFRGKSLDKSKWLYGSLLSWKNGCTDMLIEDDTCEMFDEEPVIPDTVGQYTGLKDRNGNEIYDGDIVRVTKGTAMGIGGVEWNNETCLFGLNIDGILGSSSIAGTWDIVEIIGNIHDNPELLEGKE